jgi:hypothetical protein
MSDTAVNHMITDDGVRLAYRVEGLPEVPWLVLLTKVRREVPSLELWG